MPFFYGVKYSMQHRIKESPDHLINTKTRAIVNSNDEAYEQAKLRRKQIVDKEAEIIELKSTVNTLKSDIVEIKEMLTKLLNNG